MTWERKKPAEAAKQLEILEKEIERHMAAGEIDPPTYATLKYHVDHAIESTANVIREEHLYGSGDKFYKLGDDHLANLSHAIPHAAREVLFMQKKLAKVKLKTQPLYLDCVAYFERYKGIAQRLLDLKEKIVSTKARRANKVAAAEQLRVQKFKEYATLVAVLQTHMAAYMDRAGELAGTMFDKWMTELENHGWDVDKAAPKPTKETDWKKYERAMERRSTFIAWTDAADKQGIIRKLSTKRRAEHVARARDAARGSYMAWIYKMIQKIGRPVAAAEMVGDPWFGSLLRVTTNDGALQVWHTKMIVNYSKYMRMFNQFPSRRTDGGKAA